MLLTINFFGLGVDFKLCLLSRVNEVLKALDVIAFITPFVEADATSSKSLAELASLSQTDTQRFVDSMNDVVLRVNFWAPHRAIFMNIEPFVLS